MPRILEPYQPKWTVRDLRTGESFIEHLWLKEWPVTAIELQSPVSDWTAYWVTEDTFLQRKEFCRVYGDGTWSNSNVFGAYCQIGEQNCAMTLYSRSAVDAMDVLCRIAALPDNDALFISYLDCRASSFKKLLEACSHRSRLILMGFGFGRKAARTLATMTVPFSVLELRYCSFSKNADICFLGALARRNTRFGGELVMNRTTLSNHAWKQFSMRSSVPLDTLSFQSINFRDNMLTDILQTPGMHRIKFEGCFFKDRGRELIDAVARGVMRALQLQHAPATFDWAGFLKAMANPACTLEELDLHGTFVNVDSVPPISLVNGFTHAPLLKLTLSYNDGRLPAIFDSIVHHPSLKEVVFVTSPLDKVDTTMIAEGLEINRRLSIVFDLGFRYHSMDWNAFFGPQLRRNRFLVGVEDFAEMSME